jgi:hypothetical protein
MKDSNVLVLTQVHIDIFMVMMLLLGIYWGFLEGNNIWFQYNC